MSLTTCAVWQERRGFHNAKGAATLFYIEIKKEMRMAACVVVADDLTGANATGVLLTKMQYRAATVMNLNDRDEEIIDICDCLIYPTDSRGVDPETAYKRTFEATETLKDDHVLLYSKRIDSTLRGNLGSETDAMLDSLGDDYIAVAAPCFPSSGRIVIGGYMLVNGVPLHRTNIALDPKCPVRTSEVVSLFREGSRYKVASIQMSEMMAGRSALAEKIRNCKKDGYRIIVLDCVTQEDLDMIAEACIESGEKILTVDPGVFTATLARKIIKPRIERRDNRILVVVGSVNSSTTAQLEKLWMSQEVNNVLVRTREFLEGEERREREINRVVDAILEKSADFEVSSVVGDGIYHENRIDFEPYMNRYNCSLEDVTLLINNALAQIALRILRRDNLFHGLYASGGDVTQALCRSFGASGLDLQDEVLPLAAYGQFAGGEFDGLDFITKGGSQGDSNALVTCVTYLKEKLFI